MGGDSIPTGVELVVLPSQIAPDGWVGVGVDFGARASGSGRLDGSLPYAPLLAMPGDAVSG